MSVLTDPYKRRWVGYSLLMVGFCLVGLHRTSTAVLSNQLMYTFDITATQLGLLHSSFFYLYTVLQIPAGLLTDRYGARFISAASTALMAGGTLLFSVAQTYPVAFTGRLLIGLGASVLFVAALRFCANWFRPDEFATMSGVTLTAGLIGGILATTPLAIAITAFGWRVTHVGLAGVTFVAAAGIMLFSHDTPKHAGLTPIDNVPNRPTVTARTLRRYVVDALREVETLLLGIILFFLIGLGMTILGLWGIPYLVQTYGISVTEASVYLLVANIGGAIGPTLIGWISDRLGKRTAPLAISSIIFGLTWSVLIFFGTVSLMLVGAVFFFSSIVRGTIPLAFTVAKERHPDGASATVIGIVNTMGWIGAAVLPSLFGVALDAFWTGETVNGARVYTELGYRIGFGIALVGGLIAGLCAIALHVRMDNERRDDAATADDETGGAD